MGPINKNAIRTQRLAFAHTSRLSFWLEICFRLEGVSLCNLEKSEKSLVYHSPVELGGATSCCVLLSLVNPGALRFAPHVRFCTLLVKPLSQINFSR
jgi:hypothetical protein